MSTENNKPVNRSDEENMNLFDIRARLVQMRHMMNANLMQENSRLFFLLFFCIIGVVLSIGNYTLIMQKSAPSYYVTVNEQNQYFPPIPLEEPMYSKSTMGAKTIKHMKRLFSYDYVSFIEQLNDQRHMFTEDGYESYREALNKSQTAEMIKHYKMIVKFQPTKMPELIKTGITSGGQYGWEFEVVGEFRTMRQDPQTNAITPVINPVRIRVLWLREGIHKYDEGIAIDRVDLKFLQR